MRIGEPEKNPLVVPLSVASYLGGVNGAGGTMAALRARRTTGRGQHVDAAETDTLALMFGNFFGAFQISGMDRKRNGRVLMTFNQALYCRDGSMHVIVDQEHWWNGLMDMMGYPEWAQAPEFATMNARRSATPETQDLFEAMTQAWMADHDRAELFEMSRARSINMAPYQSTPEILGMEHLKVRESIVEVDFPRAGRVRVPMPPYKLPASPPPLRPPRTSSRRAQRRGPVRSPRLRASGPSNPTAARRDLMLSLVVSQPICSLECPARPSTSSG